MNQEVLKKWTTALRSREFRQISNFFGDGEGGHCLMGVLGVLYSREVMGTELTKHGEMVTLFWNPYGPVTTWAGIEEYADMIPYIRLNNIGCSFSELADRLERDFGEPLAVSTAQLEAYLSPELVTA